LKSDVVITPATISDDDIAPFGLQSASFRWNSLDKQADAKPAKKSLFSRIFRHGVDIGTAEQVNLMTQEGAPGHRPSDYHAASRPGIGQIWEEHRPEWSSNPSSSG